MTAHLFHVRDDSGKTWWLASDGDGWHSRGRTRQKALKQLELLAGKITRIVRYEGFSRPSETAMTIADLQHSKEKS